MESKKTHPLFYLLLMLAVAACASKRDQDRSAQVGSDASTWEEMDNFHMLMAETFHPFRDSANVEPAKARASALMAAASNWASAPLPGKVNNDAMRSRLEQLKEQAAALAQTVKSQDDNAIGEELEALHDTFHEIEHAWYQQD